MEIDTYDIASLNESRRKAVARTIRAISVEELKSLGHELFPYLDNPWRETYFGFLSENADATFYHAATEDHVHVIYCREKDQGMWFIPGSGMGPLQPKGLRAMKEIVEKMG